MGEVEEDSDQGLSLSTIRLLKLKKILILRVATTRARKRLSPQCRSEGTYNNKRNLSSFRTITAIQPVTVATRAWGGCETSI